MGNWRTPSPSLLFIALATLLCFAGSVYARPLNSPVNSGEITGQLAYSTDPISIQQTIPCCATISGQLKLQGQVDHSGIQVLMWPGSNLQTTTNSTGHFSFVGLPSGDENGPLIYTLQVSYPRYLGLRTTLDLTPYYVDENSPVLIVLPELQLLGGDVNNDNRINIFDLVIVGSHYGSVGASTGDINGDGRVNIQDLAVAAGNFGKENNYNWSPP
ncbi:hypothetical protein GC175_22105 [bacterium]|nr:hypothetical protein [bacterium]